MWDNWYYKRRPAPKALPGMKKKNFGETWWGKRFLIWVETLCDSGRLARGRSYARAGLVKKYAISDGCIEASVRGSGVYSIKISLKELGKQDKSEILKAISNQAVFKAKLFSGDLPQELEKIFLKTGIPLFPSSKDVKCACSCPDWARPCKHVAAVFYTVADAFDHDPFLILKLRGINSQMIKKEQGKKANPSVSQVPEEKSLEEMRDSYFKAPLPLNSFSFGFEKPLVKNSILKRLRKPKFWDSNADFEQELGRIYSEIAKSAHQKAFAKVAL